MKKHIAHIAACVSVATCLGSVALFSGGTMMAAELKVGVQAPQFELPGSDGKTYKLADLNRQDQVVVIAWYPKAFTGG